MKKVLVTALGTLASYEIVKELKKKGYYIIGTDINLAQNIVSSLEVDEFYTFPSVVEKSQEYLEYLLKFCQEKEIDYLFAVVDEEVELISKNKKEFILKGIIPCILDYEIVDLCRNKDKTFKWIKEFFPEIYIKTRELSDKNLELKLPVFLKPKKGRASIGCQKINTTVELEKIRSKLNCDEYIVQEFKSGKIVSADILSDGNLIQIVLREEILRNSNGAAIAVKIIKDENLEQKCRKIIKKLNLKGTLNIEFFRTTEDMYVIEFNPRLPAGTGYTIRSGLNLVEGLLDISSGNKVKQYNIQYNKTYARRYEIYDTTVKK